MRNRFQKASQYLLAASFLGMALFAPFSISGANISIFLGFIGVAIGFACDPDVRARHANFWRDPYTRAGILLALSAIPSVLISENRARAFGDWRSYYILLVNPLVAYNLVGGRLRRSVFWVLFGSATLSCIVSFIQYGGGMNFGLFRIDYDYRPSSTLFTLTFAGIMYQAIIVSYAVALQERAVRRRAMLAVGLFMQLVSLLITLTRGAWLALIGGITSVPLLLRRRKALLVLVLFAALAALLSMLDPDVRHRTATLINERESMQDINVSSRFVLWDIAWDVFKAHPVMGTGMGDYSIEARKLVGNRRVRTVTDSHNIYLQILATRGLVGFIPFVLFWIVMFMTLFRARNSLLASGEAQRFGAYFVTGVIGAAIAVLIGALTENNIDDDEVFIAFMMLSGVARSFAMWQREE